MALAPGFQGGSLLSITAGGGVAQGGAGRPFTPTTIGGISMMAGADISPFDPQTGLPTRPAGTFAEAAQFAFQQNQFVNRLAQRARAQAEATIQQALGLVQRGGPGSLAVLTSPLFTQLANIRGQVTFQPFDFTAGLQQPSPFFGGGIGGIRNLAAERRQGLIPQRPSPFPAQAPAAPFGFEGFGAQQQFPNLFFESAEFGATQGGFPPFPEPEFDISGPFGDIPQQGGFAPFPGPEFDISDIFGGTFGGVPPVSEPEFDISGLFGGDFGGGFQSEGGFSEFPQQIPGLIPGF